MYNNTNITNWIIVFNLISIQYHYFKLFILYVCITRNLFGILRHPHRNSMINQDHQTRNGLCHTFIQYLNFGIQMIENPFQYFNKYSYCYIAAYGYNFMVSSSKVMTLFTNKGWLPIVNDNLIGNAFIFCQLTITASSVLIGVFLSIIAPKFSVFLFRKGVSNPVLVLGVLGGIIGYFVSNMVTNVLNSAVAMVYVCLAENPQILKVYVKHTVFITIHYQYC